MPVPAKPLPHLTLIAVQSETQLFDQEERDVERTLRKLFGLYPDSATIEDVLPKALALNHLYATGILAIDQLAAHIVSQRIDPCLREGRPEVVHQIATVRLRSGKTRNNYSFASKYCAWHNPCAYPIYDSFVEEMLWAYRKQDKFDTFCRQDLWDYSKFRRIIDSFRAYYDLAGCSYKEIDKFLWHAGQECFPRNAKTETSHEEETQSP